MKSLFSRACLIATVVMRCVAGANAADQSSPAADKRQQFKSIYHLDGGIKAWEKAGLPLEK